MNQNYKKFLTNRINFVILAIFFLSLCPLSGRAAMHEMTSSGAGVTSMDVYADGPHLHLLISNRQDENSPAQLLYLRSDDGGSVWSKPVRVGQNQAPPYDRQGMDPQIAASANRLVAVWTSRSPDSLYGRGPMATAISSDGGETWTPGPNPADDGLTGDHGMIDIAADPAGHFHLVWLDKRNGQKGLEYARSTDGGAHWSKNLTLIPATCECCWNSIRIAPTGKMLVLYRAKSPRDMNVIGTEDGGNHWSKPVEVGNFDWKIDACPHCGGGLAFVPGTNGALCHAIVWTGNSPDYHGVYVVDSSDGGKSWDAAHEVGAPGAWHPDLAVNAANQIFAVWDAYTSKGQSVFGARSNDGGKTWSAAQRLNPPNTAASYPRVLTIPSGFVAFWTQQSPGQPSTWEMKKFPAAQLSAAK